MSRARDSGIRAAYSRSSLDFQDLPSAARDCDAIIITAATASDDPVRLAGALARDRGRVVIVGDVGIDVPRSSYYGKELDLRLSRSYGPGRYDRSYEERGVDYPIGYVRWTERRNISAFVGLLADGRVSVDDLITARVSINDAVEAYDRLLNGSVSPLGLVLTYQASEPSPRVSSATKTSRNACSSPVTGVIGFSQRVVIPGLREAGFSLELVASATGLSARSAADRFQFREAVTPDEVFEPTTRATRKRAPGSRRRWKEVPTTRPARPSHLSSASSWNCSAQLRRWRKHSALREVRTPPYQGMVT